MKKVVVKKSAKKTTANKTVKKVANETTEQKVNRDVIWQYPADCVSKDQRKAFRTKGRSALKKQVDAYKAAKKGKEKTATKNDLINFFETMMTPLGRKEKCAENGIKV